MSLSTFVLILKESYPITPTVRHFVFAPVGEPSFSFIPGQFITIHLPYQGKIIKRSYSVATIPSGNNVIELAASYVKDGPGSEFLFHLKPGDTIEASGPSGRLVLRDETPARYLLVATGTGVTPYRSMLPELAERFAREPLQVVLLLGVRTREELLYGNDFMAFAEKHPQFHFMAHYSREPEVNLASFEYRGHVQVSFDTLNLNPSQDIVYLCGNPNMIDESFAALKARGFDVQTIRREKYISPKGVNQTDAAV